MPARYVTEPWLLTAAAFIILWVFWRALNYLFDRIGYGISQAAAVLNGEDAPPARSGSH